jgi:hypothetical protein
VGAYVGVVTRWLEHDKNGASLQSKKGKQKIVAVITPLGFAKPDKRPIEEILATECLADFYLAANSLWRLFNFSRMLGVEPEQVPGERTGETESEVDTKALEGIPFRFYVKPQMTQDGVATEYTDVSFSKAEEGDDVGDDNMPF